VSKKIGLVSVGLVVFVMVLMALGSVAWAAPGDHSNVVGTAHDVTNSQGNACEGCHVPHEAKGVFLWAGDINATGGGSSVLDDGVIDSTTAIKPLCYSCHDGAPTATGMNTVFDPTKANHRTKSASTPRYATWNETVNGATVRHPVVNADGSLKMATTVVNGVTTPSLYGTGRDCDMCHDPHETTSRQFIRYQRIGSSTILPVGGDICGACHSGAINSPTSPSMANHKVGYVPTAASAPLQTVFNPPTSTGTPLWLANASGVLQPSTAAGAVIQCKSCHTAHGSLQEYTTHNAEKVYDDAAHTPYTGGGLTSANVKLYGINTMSNVGAALCVNCHK
jgi:hypothetical protein